MKGKTGLFSKQVRLI